LSTSTDARQRAYWQQLILHDFVIAGQSAVQKRVEERYRDYLRHGKECKVHVSDKWKCPKLEIGTFPLYMKTFSWLGFDLKHGQTAFVQPYLMDGPSPLCYAWKALSTDPSSRLLFFVKVTAVDGKEHSLFLTTGSNKAVKYMNTLVDIMEGMPRELSITLPRRGYWENTEGRHAQYCEN
jgi:hypothetical protein